MQNKFPRGNDNEGTIMENLKERTFYSNEQNLHPMQGGFVDHQLRSSDVMDVMTHGGAVFNTINFADDRDIL